jgi:hypothetical protein
MASAAAIEDGQFAGAAGCQSSSCHGGAGEKHSQFITWTQQDFHSRAYAVLVSARSARMAETLSLPAAQTSARCTICHSPFQVVRPARLAPTAQGDEGVSCEDCHGAAGSWLRGHTRKDWTYAMRVGAGMHDLRSFYVRANTCVACHQNLEADLLAAGHPELTFELDAQSVAEPKHWRDDDRWSGARAWLVGQAVALREVSWILANKRPAPDADAAARWDSLAWLLAKTTVNQRGFQAIDLPANPTSATYAIGQEQADLLARQASSISWDERRATSMLAAAAATESEFEPASAASLDLTFRRAARLVLALDRLSRAVHRQAPASATGAALKPLFEDVRAESDFQPARFASDLATFRKTIERSPF